MLSLTEFFIDRKLFHTAFFTQDAAAFTNGSNNEFFKLFVIAQYRGNFVCNQILNGHRTFTKIILRLFDSLIIEISAVFPV